ncbi:MAG: Glu-tRNA(Gln) amidotransferase subunit GatD, partial [Nanoarchaeota archaeon]
MNYKSGDKVEVTTSDKTFKGVVMPSPELSKTDSLILKLANGYNMGIAKSKIKKVKILKQYKNIKEKKRKSPVKEKLPIISILHTGGTIASKVDYQTGGVISRFTPEEIVSQFPELRDIANIRSRLIRNMWSEDIRFAHYNLIAKEIQKEAKKGVAGIIITHGTDTLHYSSAALSFMLGNLGIPVILVGAQRSSDRGSTDAGMNLICAANFIIKTDFSGVAICMHGSISDNFCNILPATKSRKLHTSRRDAFKPVNDTLIAKVHYGENKIEFIKSDYKLKRDSDIEVK